MLTRISKKAIDALSAYRKRHNPNAKTPFAERMKKAEEADMSSLTFLNRLKEDCRVREEFAPLFCCTEVVEWMPGSQKEKPFIQ